MTLLKNLWNSAVELFRGDGRFKSGAGATAAEAFTRYAGHPEAVIVACYFNPKKSPARRRAFDRFYESIRHLDHRIIECVIGDGAEAELRQRSASIKRIYTKDVLWHKESLINRAIKDLPNRFRYVFWVDADVLFTNRSWLPEAVARLQNEAVIVQPFEFGVHMDKDEDNEPAFDLRRFKEILREPESVRRGLRHPRLWRSFAANWELCRQSAESSVYDEHGHVGFAWGARRELLEAVPLYDRALVGGADHIIAHAAVNQIPSDCLDKSFTADLNEIYEWSRRFAAAARGRLAYVPGDLYHLWHGDLKRRDYLNRIREFTPIAKNVRRRDASGLYTTDDAAVTGYVENYLDHREVKPLDENLPTGIEQATGEFAFQTETEKSLPSSEPAWTGFGGGGDFAGGGAGGEWSSDDSTTRTATDFVASSEAHGSAEAAGFVSGNGDSTEDFFSAANDNFS